MKCHPSISKQLQRQRRKAFTLVELLLVLAILALLAGLVLPRLVGVKDRANIDAAKAQIGSFATALDLFEVDNGHYPRGKAGLNDLVTQPRDASNWHQYADHIPPDPWNNAYIYECPGRNKPTSYDLSSAGPNGRPGDDDDITNWQKKK